MTDDNEVQAATPDRTEPGPFSHLVEQEWRNLCEVSDRTSPAEYPDMCLITHHELAGAMTEAFFLAKDQSSETLATVTRERDKLRHKLYRPGVLRCAKCNFRLISSVLNADTGAIYAQETTEHCPNDGAPMWRVSWEEECRASDKWGDDILARATLAEAQRDEAVGALEQSAARFRHYEKLHAEKETPDGDAKAQSNADMAEVCEGVISRIKSSRGAGG